MLELKIKDGIFEREIQVLGMEKNQRIYEEAIKSIKKIMNDEGLSFERAKAKEIETVNKVILNLPSVAKKLNQSEKELSYAGNILDNYLLTVYLTFKQDVK